MYQTEITSTSDPLEFSAVVRSRSWDWLLALRRRLNVDLQIVDETLKPLLVGPAAASLTTNLEALLTSAAPQVHKALSAAIRTRTPQAATVDNVQVVSVPVAPTPSAAGALVVARRSPDEAAPPDRMRGELELIAFWLATATEAHVLSPATPRRQVHSPSSLARLLGDVAARGSDRDLVATFAETLAVWHDLEVYGYVQTDDGEFVRAVMLPGAHHAAAPVRVQPALLPEGEALTRMTAADADRLGFPTAQELVLTRLGEGPGSWLLAICGHMNAEPEVLGLYVAQLEGAARHVVDASIARVIPSLARRLHQGGNAQDKALDIIEELEAALGLSAVTLTLATPAGAPVARVAPEAPSPQRTPGQHTGIVIARRSSTATLTIELHWPADNAPTHQERTLLDAAADLLESWASSLLQAGGAGGPVDRRASARSFDETVDRFAQEALNAGVPVTVGVISVREEAVRPDVMQDRIGRIRAQVRPADLVGRLELGDVGILLRGADQAHANALAGRLRSALSSPQGEELPTRVSIGFVSRAPGEPDGSSLVEEARAHAARQTRKA